jgi:hypothetical protein
MAHKAPPEALIEPPPPTPKEGTSWKEAEAAFREAGIGASRKLRKELQADGVSAAEAMRRLDMHGAAVAKLAATGKIKSRVGSLYSAIRDDSLPGGGADSSIVNEKYQPMIDAMTDEERLRLLPGEPERDRYRTYPDAAEVRHQLQRSYHERNKHQPATT